MIAYFDPIRDNGAGSDPYIATYLAVTAASCSGDDQTVLTNVCSVRDKALRINLCVFPDNCFLPRKNPCGDRNLFKKLDPFFYNDLCGINNRLMLSTLIRRKGKSFTPNRCPAMYYSVVFDRNAPLDHHERLDGNVITDDDITLRNDGKRADIAIFPMRVGKDGPT